MPELPEVETTRKGILAKCKHQVIAEIIVRQEKLRWIVSAEIQGNKLTGVEVLDIKRRGKYLILEMKQGSILVHLGMSGSLRVLSENIAPKKHDHIDVVFKNGTVIRYHDPRRFGSWLWADNSLGGWEQHARIKNLGPEPLSENFNFEYLYNKIKNRKSPIKILVMNTNVVVGAGNIYANESLFMSGIHPNLLPEKLTIEQIKILVQNIKIVLTKAIEQGGTTLKDFLSPDGKPGYFVQQLQVYGRDNEPCYSCNTAIEKITLGQRASYFCPKCQPL